jgi:hypothetical protein
MYYILGLAVENVAVYDFDWTNQGVDRRRNETRVVLLADRRPRIT